MDTQEMGGEAMAVKSAIESWAKANGLQAGLLNSIHYEGDHGIIDGDLMLANSDAETFPKGLEVTGTVFVRFDQESLMRFIAEYGQAIEVVDDPRAEMKMTG